MKRLLHLFVFVIPFSLSAQKDKVSIMAEGLKYNVVEIRSEYDIGWGFIIGKRGRDLYIVLPNHVARGEGDGGPNTKRNIDIKYFNDDGYYKARLEDDFESSKTQDLALAIAREQSPRFRYKRGKFGCTKNEKLYKRVRYIGNSGKWNISQEGSIKKKDIKQKKNGKKYIEKLIIEGFSDSENGAIPGTSGGPIISEDGFEGMLLGPNPADPSVSDIEALSLEFIKSKLDEWDIPYEGSKPKNATYYLSGASVGFFILGLNYGSKKNDKYDAYSNHLDPTAPVFTSSSRDSFLNDAKKYKRLEIASYALSGACAGIAYLINKCCYFKSKKDNKRWANNFDFTSSMQLKDDTPSLVNLNLKWTF